jgi:amino acid adenylation domain-containing protein/non-ribosomal peptide synthase protein (TIGR01720 family)
MVKMDVPVLLRELRARGVSMSLHDGRLRTSAPQGAITPELAEGIRTHKDTLVTLLGRDAHAKHVHAAVTPVAGRDVYPLSFAQQRLWFIDALQGASPQYNLPGALRLKGVLNVSCLQAALDALVDRHAILRTIYSEHEGSPVQRVTPASRVDIVHHDLREVPAAGQDERLDALIRAECGRPFDLRRDAMLRVGLVALTSDEHVLLFASHHIAGDGWSMGILIRDVASLYRAFLVGEANPLPSLPIAYVDYAVWQREQLSADRLDDQLRFWRDQLIGAPTLLDIPTDRPRPAKATHLGGSVRFRVRGSLTQRLRKFAQRHDATLFMTLLAAWSTLLARLGGQDDVVVGSPIANRHRSDIEPLVGFFVNTLAFRVSIDDAPDVGTLMARVRALTLAAYDHQDIPFEQVVEAVRPVRDLAHSPVFQTMLSLDNTPGGDGLSLPGLRVDPLSIPQEVVHYDLALGIVEIEGELGAALEYARDLFDEESAHRLGERFVALLEAFVDADNSRQVHTLPLMSAAERAQVTDGFNATTRSYPSSATIAEVFAMQVARRGEATALWSENETVSYAELDRRANRLAHGLRAHGVGQDDRVALVAPRGIALIVAMLGVLKAGAAYVPLEPDLPAGRLAELLADCVPAAVLSASVPGALPLAAEAWLAQPSDAPVLDHRSARDLAYVMYTSGSTGTPKGVMIEQRSVLRLAVNGGFAPLTDDDVVAHAANPAFDAATWEVWAPLLNGARVAVIDAATVLDPVAFAGTLSRAGVTALWLTVGLFNAYVDLMAEALGRLDQLLIGGDALDPRRVARLLAREPRPRRVINGYGPTETTTFAATHLIEAVEEGARSIPIGRPIGNTTIHILDERGQPVPPGVTGELVIGGAGVARGYLNQPLLTADRFLTEGDERAYRSGDLGCWRADGTIEYLGRNDGQVKLRGFRIEPGEIEAVLCSWAGVREAVVMARSDDGADRRLVAYLVTDETVDAAIWRDRLAERLPEYMLPVAFVCLDSLPLTTNGKVDRRALPAPDASALSSRGYEAPRDATEATLVAIWQDLLHIDRVGVHDNFFEIGGDSILSIQVVARANQQGMAITTRQLFEAQSIAALAAHTRDNSPTSISQEEVHGEQRLLPIQKTFLADGALDPQHFNQSIWLETPVEFDPACLTPILHAIYRQHDALRLRFTAMDDGVTAHYAPLDDAMVTDSLVVEPWSDDLAGRCDAWQRSFNLAKGPLLRAVYFTPPAGGCGRLLLVAHHLVVDGVSWRILLDDIESAQAQMTRGEPVSLGLKTDSLQHWANALAAWGDSEQAQQERAYWHAQADEPPSRFPTDAHASDNGNFAGERAVTFAFDEATTTTLLQRCHRAYRTRINELLLSGVYLGVSAWTGESRLRLRMEGHGRSAPVEGFDLTRTVGWFTTVHPLTLQGTKEDIGATIKSIKEQCRAVPRDGVGYGVLRDLVADPLLQGIPEPELEFNYLGQVDQMFNGPTRFRPAPGSSGAQITGSRQRPCRLSLSGIVAGGQLRLSLAYYDDHYQEATAQRVLDGIVEGLGAVIDHCVLPTTGGMTPSDVPLLMVDQDELDTLQARYPGMRRLYPATPMQSGLHFHATLDPSAYVVQSHPILTGMLLPDAFHTAWQSVVDRHDILRTAFVDNGDALKQLVVDTALLPWHEADWRNLDATEQDERFERYRQADRDAGFDFARPPLMRVALFRLGENRWRLLWTQHHILLDGWSMPIVYRDVMRAYAAIVRGAAIPEGAPHAYESYIAWLAAQDRDAAGAFWRGALETIDAPTPLVIDGGDGSGATGHRLHTLELAADVTEALRAMARARRTTVNTLLQWGWAWLLHRYSGESDVVFGATISGRDAQVPGIGEMVGLFISSIPVRVSFGGQTVGESIATLHDHFHLASSHGYLPLPDIQRASAVRAGTSLFDSILAFENFPLDAMADDAMSPEATGLQVESASHTEQTSYKLSLSASLGRTLSIRFGYRIEEIASDAVERMARHLETILRALPHALEATAIDLLDDAERSQLAAWSGSWDGSGPTGPAHRRFEHWAATTPEAIAVRCGDESASYAEIDAKANRIARGLLSVGVMPGGLVAVCAERGIELIAGLLGILKSGGAYLPIDPAYPSERIAHVLDDAGVRFVVADATGRAAVGNDGRRVVALEDDACFDEATDALAAIRASATDPRALAYVVYTSGSTGTPKGVLVEHRGLTNLAFAQQELYVTSPGSRVLAFASVGFDAAAWEWLMALSVGASLHICDEATRRSPESLMNLLVEQGITHATLPPVMLAQLDPDRPYALSALIVAGEACDARLAWTWAGRVPLFNAYGPSENTVAATSAPVHPFEPVVLGTPLPNVVLRVCASDGGLQPIGIPGELWLGGAGLARGYLGRDALTAERFVDADGTRFYRTGDHVRRAPDGQLHFLGRLDDQVKIRGFRVEPGEIEGRLATHEAVAENVVIARRDGNVARLVAYVVLRTTTDEASPSPRDLRAHLARQLPEHMLPSAFVMLDRLPVTSNGKVDRRALPAPSLDFHAAGYVGPRNEVEARLATIWAQLLRVERVGVEDDFFEIGGDSILAIQVVARSNQAGIAITAGQLFEARTVAALACLAGTAARIDAPQEAIEGEQQLLPIQRAFLYDGDVDAEHFNQAVLLETPPDFDGAALHAIVGAIHTRHDALRLRFTRDASGEWQARYAPADPSASLVVVESLGPDITARCSAWQTAFDLTTGPLFRAVWFEAAAGGTGRLLLVAHHLVVDGVSWRILLSDVETAWRQVAAGEPVTLTAKTSSFAQWAQALEAWKASDAARDEAIYWKAPATQLVPELPVDRASPGHGSVASGRVVTLSLDEDETRGLLQESAAAYRTRVDELLLTATYLGIRRWSGVDVLRVRMEGHGREPLFGTLDTTQTVGWFTTVHPLVLHSARHGIADAIKAVKEASRSIPHHGIGYGLLTDGNDEVSLAFNYLGQFDQVINAETLFQLAAEPAGVQGSQRRQRPARLSLNAMTFAGRLQLSLDYSDEHYQETTAQRMLGAIAAALRDIVAHCRTEGAGALTPSDVPLARVSQEQLDTLAQRYPGMRSLYPATPMQRGLHFHALLDRSAYVVQVHPVLRGQLDTDAFFAAWHDVVARHDILRTAFIREGEAMQQLVVGQAEVPCRLEDWRDLDTDAQDARFEALRVADRAEGFDFTRPPLMRVAVVRLSDDRYRLLWTQHHVLLDGWSMPLVYRDVMASYGARLKGVTAGLASPVPYERYIAWLQSRDEGTARDFWRAYLKGIAAPTPLVWGPIDGAGSGYREHSLALDSEATAALQASARAHRTTVNSLLQWAWAYLLHRYTGEDSVVFGATISGRAPEVPGIEDMVGLFINTIPVRVDFNGTGTIAMSVTSLQESFARANEHGYLPLADIQQCSGVRGAALFDSLLAFENYPLDAMADVTDTAEAPPLSIESSHNSEQTSYRLTLSATLDRQLGIRFGYQANDIADADVVRMASHMEHILRQLPRAMRVDGPIDILVEAERTALAFWDAASVVLPVADTIHGLFEAQVRRSSSAVALTHDGTSLTYDQLNRLANRVAHRLVALGVRPDDRVAIRAARGPAMLIGLLGILKSGAGYVPLDPAYPEARLAYMLVDCAPAALLIDAGEADAPCPVLMIESDEPGDETNPSITALAPEHLAYVIYTSGSTGQPKGVMVEHRHVVRLFAATERHFGFGRDDVWTLFHSFAFDFSVWEIWGALLYGGRLVIVPGDVAQSPAEFDTLLVREGVTVLNQTPSAFRALIAARGSQAHRLRVVIFGGEALELHTLLPWIERNDPRHTRLVNMYGITEITVHATYRDITETDIRGGKGSPIGHPLADLILHVLDAEGRPAPVGIPGELYVGGGGVARGYLHREELTAQRFVTDPADGTRLYRTGDLGRRRADGSIDYLGRNDFQVKIRGFRIELGEIEARLAACPGVRDAVVIARDDGADRRLVAYLVAEEGAALSAKELRERLSAQLASYMVPSAFVELDALPLTGNGKLDRNALPAPEEGSLAIQHYEAPATDTERAVAAIWQRALSVERVGRHDNFFEAGGHSLLAVRVLTDVQAHFGIELSVRDVFEKTMVSALADEIDARLQEAALRDAMTMNQTESSDQELIEL